MKLYQKMKIVFQLVLVAIVAAVAFLSGPIPVLAQEATRSLADLLGREVRMSFFQPVPMIREEIEGLDEMSILDRTATWYPFQDSDVWVYFISNNTEIDILPSQLAKVVWESGKIPQDAVTSYDVNFSDGRKKVLIVVLMQDYLNLPEETYRCRIAHSIINMVSNSATRGSGTIDAECF